MSLTAFELPPPRTWLAFEALCHDLFSREWGIDDANRIGRSGQRQYGVDIVAKPAGGWAGVQCKWIGRTSELTPADLRNIAQEALQFQPALARLIVATTAANDEPLQREARLISDENEPDGRASISVVGWDDLCAKLDNHPDVVTRHYAALARFGRPADAPQTSYSTRIENFQRQYIGDEHHTPPFVGRELKLAALDSWRSDLTRPYELIRAPAARGKSALLATWAAAIEDAAAVIYMPISARFRTNLAQVVFHSILARLSALHDRPLPANAEVDLEQARGLITDLLARPLPNEVPLVVIIDGLDEAADFEIGRDLFPGRPPLGLKVLLAGRPVAVRQDPLKDLVRSSTDLSILPSEAIRRAVTDAGATIAVGNEIVRLTQGDPLMLSLYLEALQAGELDLQKLPSTAPGLDGYIEGWWEDQKALWQGLDGASASLVESLLCVLACALGPLSRDDLLAPDLVPERPSVLQLDAALSRLSRLIVGQGRENDIVLAHPRLSDFFREEWVPPSRRRDVENRFVAWGESTAGGARLENAPAPFAPPSPYLVSHFGAHLERAGVSEDRLAPLTTRRWADHWYTVDPSLSGFLIDVDRRRRAATRQIQDLGLRPHLIVALLECALTSATVRSIANGLDQNLCIAALALGIWSPTTALEHMTKVRERDLSPEALGVVARLIPPEETASLLPLAQSMSNAYQRSLAIKMILPSLQETERESALIELSENSRDLTFGLAGHLDPETALGIAWKREDPDKRAYGLSALLPSFSQPKRDDIEREIEKLIFDHLEAFSEDLCFDGALEYLSPERQLRVMQKILELHDHDQGKVSTLREVSPRATGPLVERLIEFAATIEDEFDRGEGLGLVAESVADDQVEAFLAVARTIENGMPRAQCLGALAKEHQGPWALEAVALCKTAGLHPCVRAPILIEACRHLSAPEALALEVTIMEDLNASVDSRMWGENEPDWLLADFAEIFETSSPRDALRLIREIEAGEVRARQAAQFVLQGAPEHRDEAMAILRQVDEPIGLIDAFCWLAERTAGAERQAICEEACARANADGYANYLISAAVQRGWDLERDLDKALVVDALALPPVSDWNEIGNALVGLEPSTSSAATDNVISILRRMDNTLAISSITRAFAKKLNNAQLQIILGGIKRVESGVFAASMLEAVFPFLPEEVQSDALGWVRELPEGNRLQIEHKLRMLDLCTLGQDGPREIALAESKRVFEQLSSKEREAVQANIEHRRSSPRQPPPSAPYSREAVFQEITEGTGHWRPSDPFGSLADQDRDEIGIVLVEGLRLAGARDRGRFLRFLAGFSSAIEKVSPRPVGDEIIALIQDNVASWS
jgi:hypothetical protein